MYTVKDLFGNQLEGVSLEKSQPCDVCLGSVLPGYFDMADLIGVVVVNSS